MSRRRFDIGLLILSVGLQMPAAASDPPPCPGRVNRIETHNPGQIADLKVGAGYLLTADELGVSTWDLSDPDAPAYIDSWYERAYYPVARVDVDDRGFAYGGSGDDQWGYYVAVYDIRDPADPAPISFIPGGYYDYGIDGHTFVGIINNELTVVDLTDPFHPRVVCSDCVELGYPPYTYQRIAVNDGRAYVARGVSLWIVDLVSDPQPEVIATVDLDFSYIVPSSRLVIGDDVVILLQVGGGDEVIDVSDPADPVVHHVDLGYEASDAVIDGRSLFVSDGGFVRHFDLSDPSSPQELQFVDPDRYLYQLDVAGDRLYGTDAYRRIRVYDVSGAPQATGISPELPKVDNIAANGRIAIASTASPAIAVFDLADPSTPQQVGHLELTGISMHQVLVEDWALVALGEPNRLAVVDLSDPAMPQVASTVSTGDWSPKEIAASGNVAVVAGGDWQEQRGALLVYEMSDDGVPTLKSIVELQDPTLAVALRSNLALVASGPHVVLIDVTDLQAPGVISSLEACGEGWSACRDIATVENRAYVASYWGSGGLAVIDLTDPYHATVEHLTGAPPSFTAIWLESRGRTLLGGSLDWLFLAEQGSGDDLLFREFRSPRRSTSAALTETHAYLTSSPFLEAVTLECIAPVPDFDWHQVGMRVWFDDLTGYGAQSRTWWYGDGLSHHWDEPTPQTGHVHAYSSPGVYDVTLEVSNEWGSNWVTKTIVVPELDLWVFADSFESGDTSAWSATVP